MRKYVCDNCKQEITDLENGRVAVIDVYKVENVYTATGDFNSLRKDYCKLCIEAIAQSNWTFVDARRK